MGNADLNKDIYIVAHVMRIGKMLYSDSSKKAEKVVSQQQMFKRPHGVAIQSLGDFLTSKEGEPEEKEFSMKVRLQIFVSTDFGTLIEHTIFRYTRGKIKIFTNYTNS